MPNDAVAALVARARAGDGDAERELAGVVYPELRRLARRYLSRERSGHTLQTTDLVHEAWIRLFAASGLTVNDRAHLVALMATQMRRALVDYARRRNAAKGPGAAVRVPLTGVELGGTLRVEDVLALDQALTGLADVDPRAARVVELRFFAGLEEAEASQVLGISVATLKRDWTFARAWLLERLSSSSP